MHSKIKDASNEMITGKKYSYINYDLMFLNMQDFVVEKHARVQYKVTLRYM